MLGGRTKVDQLWVVTGLGIRAIWGYEVHLLSQLSIQAGGAAEAAGRLTTGRLGVFMICPPSILGLTGAPCKGDLSTPPKTPYNIGPNRPHRGLQSLQGLLNRVPLSTL